jgi:hypothetical protein
MIKNRRDRRREKARGYSADHRERRIAAGRPARADVASALLGLFLESAARAGASPSESLVDRLVDSGFSVTESRSVIAALVQRHCDQC